MPIFNCPYCNKENMRVVCDVCGSIWNVGSEDVISHMDKGKKMVENCPGCGKGISAFYCVVEGEEGVEDTHKQYDELMAGDIYRANDMELKINRTIRCDQCSEEFIVDFKDLAKKWVDSRVKTKEAEILNP